MQTTYCKHYSIFGHDKRPKQLTTDMPAFAYDRLHAYANPGYPQQFMDYSARGRQQLSCYIAWSGAGNSAKVVRFLTTCSHASRPAWTVYMNFRSGCCTLTSAVAVVDDVSEFKYHVSSNIHKVHKNFWLRFHALIDACWLKL